MTSRRGALRAHIVVCCMALAGCASAGGAADRQRPCASWCTLELSNGTPFELDLRLTDQGSGIPTAEELAPGETKVIVMESSMPPSIQIVRLRTHQAARGTTVRVACATPVRAGDTFRTACRVTGQRRISGDGSVRSDSLSVVH